MVKVQYDIDVCSGHTQKDYDEGINIYWDLMYDCPTKADAIKSAKSHLTDKDVSGVRVVRCGDGNYDFDDDAVEPEDVFVKFKK